MTPISNLRRAIPFARYGLAALAAFVAIVTGAASGSERVNAVEATRDRSLHVDPSMVTARLFYRGQTIQIRGTAPAGHEVAIVISGNDEPVELKLKGKVGGVIWSNIGDVTIDNVPSLYLLATSPRLHELLGTEGIESASVGYRALESRCSVSPDRGTDEGHRIFEEFVKLKEKEELYGVAEGDVQLTALNNGDLEFAAKFFIPPDVPVGSFDVRVFAFDRHDESVVASTVLDVEKAGLAGTISTMAQDRGLLYGVLSVIVALVAGVFAGIVFGHR